MTLEIIGKKHLPTRLVEQDFLSRALCYDSELESSVNLYLTQMGPCGFLFRGALSVMYMRGEKMMAAVVILVCT